jgi:preprotein translocase subunit Sss1
LTTFEEVARTIRDMIAEAMTHQENLLRLGKKPGSAEYQYYAGKITGLRDLLAHLKEAPL